MLWSHYGDGLKEFCVEFTNDASFIKNPLNIDYVKSLPAILDIYKIFLRASASQTIVQDNQYLMYTFKWMEKIFCTKLEHWRYENEWRIGNPQHNTPENKINYNVKYKVEDVSSIIIGERMSDYNKKLMQNIVHHIFEDKFKLQMAKVDNSGIIVKDFVYKD